MSAIACSCGSSSRRIFPDYGCSHNKVQIDLRFLGAAWKP
jgi:hypothetical protein